MLMKLTFTEPEPPARPVRAGQPAIVPDDEPAPTPKVVLIEVTDEMWTAGMMKPLEENPLPFAQVVALLAEHHARHLGLHPGGPVDIMGMPDDEAARLISAGLHHRLLDPEALEQ